MSYLDDRLAAVEARLDALEGKQQTPAPEPRPRLMYVDEVPADGTCEIRWWLSNSAKWSRWVRVVGASETIVDGRRLLKLHDDTLFTPRTTLAPPCDECVGVRPVFDPQTGDTLGEVA